MSLLDRLTEHRTLGTAPRDELQWLVDHGELRRYDAGAIIATPTVRLDAMYILLQGRASITIDRGAGPRKAFDWCGGDVMGLLPYSRLVVPPGNTVADEDCEVLAIPVADFRSMIRECHDVTSTLVHIMLDRARSFNSGDMHDEKMVALGKLSAGLAHELNNPASAVARSAKRFAAELDAADVAARTLGSARPSDAEIALLDAVRDRFLLSAPSRLLSAIERADREEAIADWLREHGADESMADALAETVLTIEALDELAATLTPTSLDLGLRWMTHVCSLRRLAFEIEQAAIRISDLVAAVKGFTYMDQARTPQPMDVGVGLRNTLAVLTAKARSKSVSVSITVPDDLPMIVGLGGELNQVWANLIDNAIDAVAEGGHVDITVGREGGRVVIRITDDGPGVPEAIRERIFDPFFTTKQPGKGTGLGLDIAKRLVRQNNGELTLQSEPGRTTFTIALPVAPVTAAEASA